MKASLYDQRGKLVTQGEDEDGVIILGGDPTYTGRYELRISVHACGLTQCAVAVATLLQEPEPVKLVLERVGLLGKFASN